MLRSARSRSSIALLALGVLLASSCGAETESGVNVKTIATDLIYGIPETAKPAPPANTATTTTDPLKTVLQGGDKPTRIPPPSGLGPAPCPPTPPTVFPPEAPSEISGVPKEGTYMWRTSGSQVLTGIGKVRLPPFTRKEVLDVGSVNGGPRFTISEREQVVGSQFTVRSIYEYRVGGVDEDVQGQSVDRTGLYLVKVARIHRTNPESNSEFNPSPPILVLPQPAVLGDAVDSAGVDPVSLEVLRQEAILTKRVRVDACGKPQDAFFVEGFQDFVSSSGQTTRRKYEYGIATVMGGLPIVEHIESPCVDDNQGECQKDAVMFTLDAHIGQLEPDR